MIHGRRHGDYVLWTFEVAVGEGDLEHQRCSRLKKEQAADASGSANAPINVYAYHITYRIDTSASSEWALNAALRARIELMVN